MKTSDLNKLLGDTIHKLRKEKEWSQPQLGKMVGTSGAVIGRYERGDMTPSVKVARNLAHAFGVTLDYLVSGIETDIRDKEMLIRWQELEALPKEDKERIIFVIDALIRDAKARKAYR